MISSSPLVSIVIVPRHQFGIVRECVETLYSNTNVPFEVIFADNGSSKGDSQWLKAQETHRSNFRVAPIQKFSYPFEAKNEALKHVSESAEWVVFMDNDVKVHVDWLSALLQAAHETGAQVVHPLYLIQMRQKTSIHMARGQWKPMKNAQGVVEVPQMQLANQPLEKAEGLERSESGFVEFHSWMIHRDVLKKLGSFEPLSIAEHIHYSLRLREMGEKIVFEPKSIITYVADFPNVKEDKAYTRFRWSDRKARESVDFLLNRWQEVSPRYWKAKVRSAQVFRNFNEPWYPVLEAYGKARSYLKSMLTKLRFFHPQSTGG